MRARKGSDLMPSLRQWKHMHSSKVFIVQLGAMLASTAFQGSCSQHLPLLDTAPTQHPPAKQALRCSVLDAAKEDFACGRLAGVRGRKRARHQAKLLHQRAQAQLALVAQVLGICSNWATKQESA